MKKKSHYVLTPEVQVIFETVIDEKQGIAICIENAPTKFLDCTTKQLFTYNELYYATSLKMLKKLAKEISGSSHATPYIFLDMVWMPLQMYNRNTILYVALHHIVRQIPLSPKHMRLELRGGLFVTVNIGQRMLNTRIAKASMLKNILEMRKKDSYQMIIKTKKQREIVKENGSVYYVEKEMNED